MFVPWEYKCASHLILACVPVTCIHDTFMSYLYFLTKIIPHIKHRSEVRLILVELKVFEATRKSLNGSVTIRGLYFDFPVIFQSIRF
jgi:hypothetical protein